MNNKTICILAFLFASLLQSCSVDVGGNEDGTAPTLTIDAVIDYLQAGGRMLLFLEPQVGLLSPGGQKTATNLEEFLKTLGIDAKTDHLSIDWEIRAGRTRSNYFQTEEVTTTEYGFHDIVEDLQRTTFASLFPGVSPILSAEPEGEEEDEELEREALVYMRRAAPATLFERRREEAGTDQRARPVDHREREARHGDEEPRVERVAKAPIRSGRHECVIRLDSDVS